MTRVVNRFLWLWALVLVEWFVKCVVESGKRVSRLD